MEETKQKSEENQVLVRKELFTVPEGSGELPHLIGVKCSQCGDVDFPKKTFCSECDSQQVMDEVLMGEKGILHTYTIVRGGFPNFEYPLVLGLVELPEGKNLRILAQLEECPEEELKIGMPLELLIGKIKSELNTGKAVIGYKYRPVRESL